MWRERLMWPRPCASRLQPQRLQGGMGVPEVGLPEAGHSAPACCTARGPSNPAARLLPFAWIPTPTGRLQAATVELSSSRWPSSSSNRHRQGDSVYRQDKAYRQVHRRARWIPMAEATEGTEGPASLVRPPSLRSLPSVAPSSAPGPSIPFDPLPQPSHPSRGHSPNAAAEPSPLPPLP